MGPITERDFGDRGRRLWREMHDAVPGALQRELLIEACRLADRLDKMHALLRGDTSAWTTVRIDFYGEGDVEYVVKVSGVATEARQTATALKAIVGELRAAMVARKTGEGEAAQDGLEQLEDQLAAKRAARAASS